MHSFLFAKPRRHYAKVVNCGRLRMCKQSRFRKKSVFLKTNNIFFNLNHDIYTKLLSESSVKIKATSLQLFFVHLVTSVVIRLLHGKEIVLFNIFKATNNAMTLTDFLLKSVYKVLQRSWKSVTQKQSVQFLKLFYDGDPII